MPEIKLLTRKDILSLKRTPIDVRLDGGEQLSLRVLSLGDAEALAARASLGAVEFTVLTLAHQSLSPSPVEVRLRALPRPTVLRVARTWAAEHQNLSVSPGEIRRFADFKRLSLAKVDEWQQPIRALEARLAAQFAPHRKLDQSMRIQEQLQKIAATAAVVKRAADSLREVGASFAQTFRTALPDPKVLAEAFREADEGKAHLDRHGYGFAIGEWGIVSLRRVAREKPSSREVHSAFLAFTRGDRFRRRFLGRFESNRPLSRRHSVVEAALQAHVDRAYALSIPVLYAQLEGVLTDLLVSQGLAVTRGTKAYKLTGGELYGLGPKTKKYAERQADFGAFVTASILEALSPDRNAVLHGMKISYARAKTSARLLLLVDTLAAMIKRQRASRIEA